MNKDKVYYNHNLLTQYCTDNSIKLNMNYENLKINRDTKIIGDCFNKTCCNSFEKSFKNMIIYGAFCKICAKQNQRVNMKKTNNLKYGVDNPFQSNEIKEKIKKLTQKNMGLKILRIQKKLMTKK